MNHCVPQPLYLFPLRISRPDEIGRTDDDRSAPDANRFAHFGTDGGTLNKLLSANIAGKLSMG